MGMPPVASFLPSMLHDSTAASTAHHSAERMIDAPLWYALGALVAIDIAWLVIGQAQLSTDSYDLLLQLIPVIALCAVASVRLRQWPLLGPLSEGGLFMLTAWPALRLLNHLTMTTAMPLADGALRGG